MKMPTVRVNEVNEVPIPKWVRMYAFAALILAIVLLTIAAFYFKISRVTPVSVARDQTGYFVVTAISDFEAISALDSVEFQELSTNARVRLVLLAKEYSLDGSNIKIPVAVIGTYGRFEDMAIGSKCQGFIVIENATLMSKVLNH